MDGVRNTGIFGYREGIVRAIDLAKGMGVNGKLLAALEEELAKATRAYNRLYGEVVNAWSGPAPR